MLSRISEDSQLSVEEMRAEYHRILADKTARAFIDGRTSHEYRKECFHAVLRKFLVNPTEEYLDILADVNQNALADALCLKSGAISLLARLSSQGKKILIMTE